MVLVQGDDGGEPWLGHIQSVDTRNKTCQLHFYVESHCGSRCYQREHTGHHALETIHWASICWQSQWQLEQKRVDAELKSNYVCAFVCCRPSRAKLVQVFTKI